MTLLIDFNEAENSGTLAVEVRVGPSYGSTVSSFDVFSLDFDSTQATLASVIAGPGLLTSFSQPTPSSLTFAGFVTGPDVSPGALLATLVFTLSSGTNLLLSGITGDLNGDATDTHPNVACFALGTMIRTRRGEVSVETLRPGDEVRTLLGQSWSRVVWLGSRTVRCARHPRPHDVMPVRILRDAFAPGMPERDLVLSPDHGLYIDGALIPVRYLLNGATILQEAVAQIRYFHVELDRHDVLLAEGLPAESYLDTGNRSAFANGGAGVMAHPHFAHLVWDEKACAQLVCSGPALAAARAMLLSRVAELGHEVCDDPKPRLMVDGCAVLSATGGQILRFDLPDGARDIRLVTRSVIPAQRGLASEDHRRLGVAVSAVHLDGAALELNDPGLSAGWHQPEELWRWTDGEAVLLLPNGRVLEITLAMTAQYWTEPPTAWASAA